MKKEDKKPVYIICPRCELNYINKKEKYCTVCKAEMGLVDPSILIPDEEEVGVEKLCPVCQLNYIGEDEEICFLCQKERDEKEKANIADEWKEFSIDHTDALDVDGGVLPLGDDEIPLVAGDEDEEEEDEFVPAPEPDDFDFGEVDPDDYVDDEDEEEDEEDEDF